MKSDGRVLGVGRSLGLTGEVARGITPPTIEGSRLFVIHGCVSAGRVSRVETEEQQRVAVRVRAIGVAGREGGPFPSPVDFGWAQTSSAAGPD